MDNLSLVVFQGELAVASGTSALGPQLLKTTTPFSCIVVSLYNSISKVGALAHIDDYTDVSHVIQKMCQIAKQRFGDPCSSRYEAVVMGGTSDYYSVQHKNFVVDLLKKYNIEPAINPLSTDLAQRPQITLNLHTGQLSLLQGAKIDQRLEYLQRREYGEWNRWLDQEYPGVDGSDIPYFQGKVATRLESDIPSFKADTEEDQAAVHLKFRMGQIHLPISPARQVMDRHDELFEGVAELG